jgi:hypothetical protein
MTRYDWLAKYPRAAALLQGDEEVLDYTPDPEGAGGLSLLEINQMTYEAAMILKNHLRIGTNYAKRKERAHAECESETKSLDACRGGRPRDREADRRLPESSEGVCGRR